MDQQTYKKPLLRSEPTNLESVKRPHYEFTATSNNSSSSNVSRTSFDDFESDLERDFSYNDTQSQYSTHTGTEPSQYEQILPVSQRDMNQNVRAQPAQINYAVDATSMIDWARTVATFSQIEIMEASQSIDYVVSESPNQKKADSALTQELQTGMFDTENTATEIFQVEEKSQVQYESYNQRWQKFYHFEKSDVYNLTVDIKTKELPNPRKMSFKAAPISDKKVEKEKQQSLAISTQQSAQLQRGQQSLSQKQPNVPEAEPFSPLASEQLHTDMSLNAKMVQLLDEPSQNEFTNHAAKKKAGKPKKKAAKAKPCECKFEPYIDSNIQINDFVNTIEDFVLLPIKVFLVCGIVLLLAGQWLVLTALRAVENVFLFLVSLWESRNFRLPVVLSLFCLPVICSACSLITKTFLLGKYRRDGPSINEFDASKVLNYNFMDRIEQQYLPNDDYGNTFLEKLEYGIQYNRTIEEISNYEQYKLLSSQAALKYIFEDTENTVTEDTIKEDDTRLLLDDFRSFYRYTYYNEFINNCAYIRTPEMYIAVPCNFEGPSSLNTRSIDILNMRSRLLLQNLTAFTFSDEYGNSFRILADSRAKMMFKEADSVYNVSELFILSDADEFIIETLFYDKNVEKIGNVYMQSKLDDNMSIELLIPRGNVMEQSINLTIIKPGSKVPNNLFTVKPEMYRIFNTELQNMSYNSLQQISEYADEETLNLNLHNLHEEINDNVTNEYLLRPFLQALNWRIYYEIYNAEKLEIVEKDGYRYYYLIYNVYTEFIVIVVTTIYLVYCSLKITIKNKPLFQPLLIVISSTLVLLEFFFAKYILTIQAVINETEIVVLILIVVQSLEKSLFCKRNIRILLVIMLLNHLESFFDCENQFRAAVFVISSILGVFSLSGQYSVEQYIRTTLSSDYFTDNFQYEIPYSHEIFLRVIDSEYSDNNSLILQVLDFLYLLRFRLTEFFSMKKRRLHSQKKLNRQEIPEQGQHVKLNQNLILPSHNLVETLYPESTAPWSVEISKFNDLNIENESGYYTLETNIKPVSNESLQASKDKFVQLHPLPIAIPTIQQLVELDARLPHHYPRFLTWKIDVLTDRTTIPLHLLPQQSISAEPYEAKLKYFILPSERQQTEFVDVSTIITNSNDTLFDEICFFSTTFGFSYDLIIKEVNSVGKMMNYMVYPFNGNANFEKIANRQEYNFHEQYYLGNIRIVTVQDAGFNASNEEPPINSIIRDCYFPKLNKTELLFIVAALFNDKISCGQLPAFKGHSYIDRVNSELFVLYQEIADELSDGNSSYTTDYAVNVQKLVFLMQNTPLAETSFLVDNQFKLTHLSVFIESNLKQLIAYIDNINREPEKEHFSEFSQFLNMKQLEIPTTPENSRFLQLILITHSKLLEKLTLSFFGYCLDVLTVLILKQNNYILKTDISEYYFVYNEEERDLPLSDCQNGCVQEFFESYEENKQIYIHDLCPTCQEAFIKIIVLPLLKYEDYASRRFLELANDNLRQCQCQEDVLAVLNLGGFMSDEFTRLLLKKELNLLYEAKAGGNQAYKSSRTCFVQVNQFKCEFNARNCCEVLYSGLIKKARLELLVKIGNCTNQLEKIEMENEWKGVLDLCSNKRIKVFTRDKQEIVDLIEHPDRNLQEDIAKYGDFLYIEKL